MDSFTTVFIFGLLFFFFIHFLYFFNLNWQSRKTIHLVNVLALWFYIVFLVQYFLSTRQAIFETNNQHLILLGGVLLLIFVITDFFSGSKSLGLLFSILILLLGVTGVVNIHYQEIIYHFIENPNNSKNAVLFLDKMSILFFVIAILLSVIYYYSFLEVKYHQRFFFTNRFPGFDRLSNYIDIYLLVGCIFAAVSLYLSIELDFESRKGRFIEDWYIKIISAINIFYYLALLYIRYRKWFSSKLNLYWMLLSVLLLVAKVGYWL